MPTATSTTTPVPGVLTVALPTSETPLSFTERVSLRLALWLLLRTDRTRQTVLDAPSGLLRAEASDATSALSRENALTLDSYRLLRQLR